MDVHIQKHNESDRHPEKPLTSELILKVKIKM